MPTALQPCSRYYTNAQAGGKLSSVNYNMRMLRKLLILFLLLAGCWRTGSAQQVKPVQVIPQLLQPYSIYLSDYYSQDREKMVVTLISRDLQKPVLSVKLRMSIEGQSAQLRSKAYADLPLLQLEAGVPLRLSLQDLAPYFHPNNLDVSGITRSQFQQQGRLPEGLYSFCFEAVEVNTGQVVSQKSCATAWLSLSDPPLVNLPRKGELIPYRDPQNIIFQWTPRHLASSAFAAEYEFTLVELWDTGVAPEVAFRTAQPLYQTTTRTTTLLYGPAEPALLPGRCYGWRVRAKGGIGAETTELFRNSGYTEVHWFTYQADCPAPRQALARAESGRAEIAWLPDPTAFRYLVEYRELGNSKADQWHKVRSSESRAMLYELKAGRSYEYRVGSQCGTVSGEDAWAFSPLHRFDMPERVASQGLAQCNLEPLLNLTNKTQLEALQPGEVIMAGDFPVRLLRVSGQKSFTGTGYVVIPFLGETRVRVQFANIQVNTDYQLIAGVIETVYDASEGQIADVGEVGKVGNKGGIVWEDNVEADIKVDFVIPSVDNIVVSLTEGEPSKEGEIGATLTITGQNGEIFIQKINNLPTSIQDKDGNLFVIDERGNISKSDTNGENQETVEVEKANDSTQVYITYGKQKYRDKDVIFLPFDINNNIKLAAVVENDTTKNKLFTWKGTTSFNNDQATLALGKITGSSAQKVELIYGSKTITVSLNIIKAYFERLPDGISGQRNLYGYDEMDKANSDDDHVSVETNGETYIDLKTSTKNLNGIFLMSDNNQIAEAVIDGKKVKIIGKSLNKQQTVIRAYTVNDSSTAIAKIAVNVYDKVNVDGNIFSVYLTGSPSTQVSGGLSAGAVKAEANKHLKSLVVEINTLNTGVQIPVAYDLNGNGKLDFYKNDPQQPELSIVYKELLANKLKFNDIVRFKDTFTRNWVIMDSVKKGDNYILVKSNEGDKGLDLSKPFGEYSLQSPSGARSEPFQILNISGDTVFITTSTNVSSVKGFTYDHPKTSNLKTSHVIVSLSETAGLSPYEGNPNSFLDDRPALVCESTNFSVVTMGERIAHELMHGQGLRDVNDNTNIMNFNTTLSIGNQPFRYQGIDPVKTGTNTIDHSYPKQNQWELIKAR